MRVAFPKAEFLLRMLSTSPRKFDDIDIRKVEARVRAMAGTASDEPILVDREIGDMVSANMSYQTLTEALSRKFGLMRLAITGRN
ncbi:hypothetical protein EBB59_02575 [Lysobacter pythonis]|uniref:Uncharacterized protein n=2 Tax=Solilutibacter pythonis TaxID=2483112 RepID=A0A3M2HWG6_9GAMM|nr:hypothetical protein EBB59_02575 [Lysobacter pythonis]